MKNPPADPYTFKSHGHGFRTLEAWKSLTGVAFCERLDGRAIERVGMTEEEFDGIAKMMGYKKAVQK